jgi:hypothetical protein
MRADAIVRLPLKSGSRPSAQPIRDLDTVRGFCPAPARWHCSICVDTDLPDRLFGSILISD